MLIASARREGDRIMRAHYDTVLAKSGGVFCTGWIATITPVQMFTWWEDVEPEPTYPACSECGADLTDDGEPLAVYRSGGFAYTCHLACFDEDDPEGQHGADRWDQDRWPDYPDDRSCEGCDREIIIMQPIPGARRSYCTDDCYWEHRNEARRRPAVTHTCRHCGGEFVARADALTCSVACRKALQRSMQKVVA